MANEILEEFDLFEPAKVTIKIRPIVKVVNLDWREESGEVTKKEYTSLWFSVEVGKDAIAMWDAQFGFYGPRKGPEWEAVKEEWQNQFNYISRYLGEAMLKSGLQLCYENEILMYAAHGYLGCDAQGKTIRPDIEKMLQTSFDLQLFDEINSDPKNKVNVNDGASQELQALRNTNFQLPMFQYLVAWFAYGARARMRNEALLQVGSNKLLRFSDEMADKYLSVYEELLAAWTEAKRIIRATPVGWESEVKKYRKDLPDDLIKAAKKNKPSRVARVHAARVAGFRTYASPEKTIGMAQEQTIKRELNHSALKVQRLENPQASLRTESECE